MSYDNAKYLRERYSQLRAAGLCTDCKEPSGDYSICERCSRRKYAVEDIFFTRRRVRCRNCDQLGHQARTCNRETKVALDSNVE